MYKSEEQKRRDRALAVTGGKRKSSFDLAVETERQQAHESYMANGGAVRKEEKEARQALEAHTAKVSADYGSKMLWWPNAAKEQHKKHAERLQSALVAVEAYEKKAPKPSNTPAIKRLVSKDSTPEGRLAKLEKAAIAYEGGVRREPSRMEAPKSLLRGKKGGTYYLSGGGKKVYVGK